MSILFKLLDKSQPIGVAFSGGEDSLYAAHILQKYKYRVTLYHFNHKLENGDDAIANNAEKAAKELGLTFISQNCKAAFTKGSKEDFCRKQRYKWLATIGGLMITAHHLGDATEGYLFNCLRGCPEYLPIPISSTFGATTIVRPFIVTPKDIINHYIQKNDLAHLIVHDYLNDDSKIMRIWIRKSLIPEIKGRTNIEKVVKKKYLKKLVDISI